MTLPELMELRRAEQLFDDGKFDKAFAIFCDKTLFEEISFQEKQYFQFLKGLLLIYLNKSEELIELGERIIKEGKELNDYLQLFDGLFFKITGLCTAFKFTETQELLEKADGLIKLLSNTPENILNQRKARIIVLKGWINMNLGNIELAENCFEEVLNSKNNLDITFEIIWANTLMTLLELWLKVRPDSAMVYAKKALSLAEKIRFNHYWIARSFFNIGRINFIPQKIDIALEYFNKSLLLFKKLKNTYWIARVLCVTGVVYTISGDYDLAVEYFEESLALFETQSIGLEFSLDNLIDLGIQKGDINFAQKYFSRLESYYNQTKNDQIEILYKYNKALILKGSPRIRDKAKVEELLKDVFESKYIQIWLKRATLIHLCDVLLAEFQMTKSLEVQNELNYYINRLLTIAEKLHSYDLFCETFILQAKLALINYNIITARRFLTQAQKIAESYDIKPFAKKISQEHDNLLKQLDLWEKLQKSGASLSERWELAGLNEQMQNMVRKEKIEVPNLSEEESVFLLILSEGGVPFYSHSFKEDRSFASHLFGGFLTTIDHFIREMFSEGLDRAIFGDYTLVMKSVTPFFVSYIFKGNSYYALQKTDDFIDRIQKDEHTWNKLLKYLQANQSIQLKDFPQLDSLIREIFISKNPA